MTMPIKKVTDLSTGETTEVSWTEDELLEVQNYRDNIFPSEMMEAIRMKRNQLLAETDWVITMHKEKDTNIPAAWKTYRQALRDLPANTEDPANPVWPIKPE